MAFFRFCFKVSVLTELQLETFDFQEWIFNTISRAYRNLFNTQRGKGNKNTHGKKEYSVLYIY